MGYGWIRRVHRCRLSLRDRQAARGREEESGGQPPLAWGGEMSMRLSAKTYIPGERK